MVVPSVRNVVSKSRRILFGGQPRRPLHAVRLEVTQLEDRTVPATVFYDATAHLPVANTLLINQSEVFASAGYDPNVGPLVIQLNAGPAQGTLQLVDGYDFVYTPGFGASGTDSFAYEVLQGGVSLVGVQEVVFDLGSGPIAQPVGLSHANITFLGWELSATNSDRALFLPDSGDPPIDPIIDLSVLVQGAASGGPLPTGEVLFTYTESGGSMISLGVAEVQPDGTATIQVDSGILARPGIVVEAHYSGDAFFAANTGNDGGAVADGLLAPVVGDDLRNIPANAQNLTIVIVRGINAAQTLQWLNSARAYYGANAYVVTNVDSVQQLADALANVPAGSVTRLVIGAHGNSNGPWLGREFFNPRTVNARPPAERNVIRNVLANNAVIELQCCRAAEGPTGSDNMQGLANIFGVRVRGPDSWITRWDDSGSTIRWVTKYPQ